MGARWLRIGVVNDDLFPAACFCMSSYIGGRWPHLLG